MSFGDGEFRFWTEPALRYRVGTSNLGSPEDDYPSSPLLPHDHHYSNPSTSSRSRAIEQGRRELMEMVRAMPESTFELSLKDMVDEQQSWKESRKEVGPVGEAVDEKQEPKSSYKKRRKGSPAGTRKDRRQMSRNSSMETGTFMIKLFFPAFLTSKKKPPKGGNRFKSKVSPRTSIDRLENRDDSESWSQKSTAAPDQGIHKKHGSSESTTTGRSSSCKGESLPSCWPFEMVKGKMRRQRTCNF